jgi:hypothetical protein
VPGKLCNSLDASSPMPSQRIGIGNKRMKMGLDVYMFESEKTKDKSICSECGNENEIEYNRMLFSGYLTHNLNKVCDAVGIYELLWNPDKNGIDKANLLINSLEVALDKLKKNSDDLKKLYPENEFGTQESLLNFISAYLDACRKNPTATIKVRR